MLFFLHSWPDHPLSHFVFRAIKEFFFLSVNNQLSLTSVLTLELLICKHLIFRNVKNCFRNFPLQLIDVST